MRRLIGFVMLFVALIGILISIIGVVVGFRFVDGIGAALDETLTLAASGVSTTSDTLALTKQTVEQAEQGIDTVVVMAENLATTVDDTRPLLDDVSTVATSNVPDSLEAVENSIPALVEVAGAIDSTLQTLEAFQFSRSVLGVEFAFDLGIDYQPEQPFDESVAQIGTSLEGVPDSLRALESDLTLANENLATISGNILTISEDLATINESIGELPSLIDDYIALVEDINDLIARAQENINQQLQNVKIGIIVLFAWFGLNQIVPLFLGLDLLADGTLGSRKETEVVELVVPEDEAVTSTSGERTEIDVDKE